MLIMAPCTQLCRHGITVLLNSISNHPLNVDTMLPSCALRVGRVVSVIRQLCYEFLLRQLGNAGGVDPLLPQHLSAPAGSKLHHSMRHGCVYSIELTGKWHRVNLHVRATLWLDLTHRERMKQMSATARCKAEMLWGFGVHATTRHLGHAPKSVMQGPVCCQHCCLPHRPDALVGTSDDSW